MDFALDETQQAVANLAAEVLRRPADDARTLASLGAAAGYDEQLWKAMAQAGLLGLAAPPAVGGDGQGAIAAGVVLTEVGRQTLPVPALATLALATLPIAAHGTPDQQITLLGGVPDGTVLTAALRDAPGGAVVATGDRLSGVRVGVPYAAQARAVLVPHDAGTAVVDPHGDGVQLVRTPSSTGSPEYTVRLDSACPTDVVDATTRDVDRFAVAGAAAVADGVIAGALALTAEHLRSRQQFGRPLATFQAVAQQIADVYVTARSVHLLAVSTAWRLSAGLDADDDLAVAAYWLADRLPAALQVCHHLHGGLGVDITYPLHRYYAHAKDLARLVGGAATRLERLGDLCSSN